MSANRRDFLSSMPVASLGMLGMDLFSAAAEGAANQPPMSPDVVKFWVKSMGIDPNSIAGGAEVATRAIESGGLDPAVQREPQFYHVDNSQYALIAGHNIEDKLLIPSGDVKVNFRLARLRLNSTDQDTFRRFTSGGIYLDLSQNPQATDVSTGAATSFFSALLPNLGYIGGKKTKAKGKSDAPKSGAPDKAPGSSPGGSIALQKAAQSQTLMLTKGAGSTAFSCFAKDEKKSIFGQFISVLFSDQAASMIPILSLPVVGTTALTAIRTLVANFQAHGENQWIMRSGPMDIVATKDGLSLSSPESLRIANGLDQYPTLRCPKDRCRP